MEDLKAASGPEETRTTFKQTSKQASKHTNNMLDYTKEAQRRINREIASLTMEQTNTQTELDKVSNLRLGKKRKLRNALKELNEKLSLRRQLARKVDEYSAAIRSYALWQGGFWTDPRDFIKSTRMSNCSDEAVAFVNFARFAIPCRIGLALISASLPRFRIAERIWFNVVDQTAGGLDSASLDIDWDSFAEEFKVMDEAAGGGHSLNNIKEELMELFSYTPLNIGSGIETEMVYELHDSGESSISAHWSFELKESDFSDEMFIVELKKFLDFPLKVAGNFTFDLRGDGKVQQIKLGSWSINEQVIPELASRENSREVTESDKGGLEHRSKDLFN